MFGLTEWHAPQTVSVQQCEQQEGYCGSEKGRVKQQEMQEWRQSWNWHTKSFFLALFRDSVMIRSDCGCGQPCVLHCGLHCTGISSLVLVSFLIVWDGQNMGTTWISSARCCHARDGHDWILELFYSRKMPRGRSNVSINTRVNIIAPRIRSHGPSNRIIGN